MLYTLRFRHPRMGVQTVLIQTSDVPDTVLDYRQAEAIGQKYCERESNHKYISVERAIKAGPEILLEQSQDQDLVVVDVRPTGANRITSTSVAEEQRKVGGAGRVGQ